MVRKIYDIIPNEKVAKKEGFSYQKRKKKRKPFLMISLFLIVCLTGVFFFMPGKAEVQIYPSSEDFSIEANLTVDAIESMIDYENNIIPGIIFSDTREVVETYLSTGTDSKTKRATGTIKVFNKIKPAEELKIRSGTRFLSVPGGLIYKSSNSFTIPAAKSDGTPGSIEIEVTAEEAGTKYNIPSATFSLPGLSGLAIYSSIWAETVTSLSGGEESQIKIVTKGDISSSKEEFEEKYIAQAKENLINSIPNNYVYDSESINSEMKDLYVNVQEGAEVEKFNISGKTESSILSTREEDLIKMGEFLIKKEISEMKTIAPDSIFCEIKERVVSENKIELKVVFTSKIYSLPEEEIVENSLRNQEKDYAISVLENMMEIDKVEINVFPFWRTVLPQKEESINIELKFNN